MMACDGEPSCTGSAKGAMLLQNRVFSQEGCQLWRLFLCVSRPNGKDEDWLGGTAGLVRKPGTTSADDLWSADCHHPGHGAMLLPRGMGPFTGLSPDPYPHGNVHPHCYLYGGAADSHGNCYVYANGDAAAHADGRALTDHHADAYRN